MPLVFLSRADDFQPASIDTKRPGRLSVENSHITVEMHEKNEEKEMISFESHEVKPVKDHKECVLIFDQAKQEFRIERLTKQVKLRHKKRKNTGNKRPADVGTTPSRPKKRKDSVASPASSQASAAAPAPRKDSAVFVSAAAALPAAADDEGDDPLKDDLSSDSDSSSSSSDDD